VFLRSVAVATIFLSPMCATAGETESTTNDPFVANVLRTLPEGTEAVSINTFPDDLPCSSLKHNADGSWILKDVVILPGKRVFGPTKFGPGTKEAKSIDIKCDPK